MLVARQLQRHRLGEADHGGLGGRVGRQPLDDAETQERGDVDDRAAGAVGRHAPRRLLADAKHAVEVDGHHLAPFLLAGLGEERAGGNAGVVDQDGDRPQRRLGAGERASPPRRGRLRPWPRPRPVPPARTNLAASRSSPSMPPRRERDLGAGRGQHAREMAAEARRRPRSPARPCPRARTASPAIGRLLRHSVPAPGP